MKDNLNYCLKRKSRCNLDVLTLLRLSFIITSLLGTTQVKQSFQSDSDKFRYGSDPDYLNPMGSCQAGLTWEMSDVTSPAGDAASLKGDEDAFAKFQICHTAVE
jgi:hypothetical protein